MNKIAKPYQETSSETLDEIKANQQKIIDFQAKVDEYDDKCEFAMSQRGICNPRAYNYNKKQIIKLQKRNSELAIKSRFS